ncbi:MAG: VOC family protein [Actinomycetota bacterium]
MVVRHVGVTLDCLDLDRVAGFWTSALGYREKLRDGDYALLVAPEAVTGLTGLTLQRVPEQKAVKNRMHLDVVVDRVAVEVARLERLGAAVIAREVEPTPYETVVMVDPEGNEFCVVRAVD